MGTSNIEWTDSSWNLTSGCRAYSPGCAHCYAETMSKRIKGMARADMLAGKNPGRKAHYLNVIGENGRWNNRVDLVPEALSDPLGWKKPRRIFVNSMSDLFYGDESDRRACESQSREFTPVPFGYIDQVFSVMAQCPHHTFQVLTKRPGRMAEYMAPDRLGNRRQDFIADAAEVMQRKHLIEFPNWPLPNVWLGTSIENRACLDRAMELSKCPAAIHFWSLEPLLEDLGNIRGYLEQNVEWVIVGGESGPGSRQCHIEWIESIVDQCRVKSIPCFVKQIGSAPTHFDDGDGAGGRIYEFALGPPDYQAIKDSKGGNPDEWPECLRVRQFPQPSPVAP